MEWRRVSSGGSLPAWRDFVSRLGTDLRMARDELAGRAAGLKARAVGLSGSDVLARLAALRGMRLPFHLPRRLRPPPGTIPVLKLVAGAAGLWVATEVASLVGDLAAAPKPDLGVTLDPPAPSGRPVRQVDTTLWQPVSRPAPLLSIASQELDGLAFSHEARRNAAGIREDLMTFGTFDDGKPMLQLVSRLGTPDDHARSFVIETVRRAGQIGLAADRIAQPTPVATKLGTLEAGDIVLGQSGQERACLAFRSFGQDMPLTVSGWWCGTAQRPADRQQLACLIDRLMLAQGGEHDALRAQFTAAELKRDPRCNPPRLAVVGRKTTWLDADSRHIPLRNGTEAPEPPARSQRTRTGSAR